MKKLNFEQMEVIEGGKVNGWACAGAIFGTLAVTAGAAAIIGGSAGSGTAVAVFLLAKTASTLSVVGACS